tara:strand:+ start:85 stop:585 length:501 start_codon:yes stop_codon:yes gene_type:complete
MFVLYDEILQDLTLQADLSARSRQTVNIHASYQEPCQRLLNAINIGSYIPPHRHSLDPKKELLVAIRGKFAVIEFSGDGLFSGSTIFGSEKYCVSSESSYGVEIPVDSWHTVIALEPESVLLEVKEGPFDVNSTKEIAPWAPDIGAVGVDHYVRTLYEYCDSPLCE